MVVWRLDHHYINEDHVMDRDTRHLLAIGSIGVVLQLLLALVFRGYPGLSGWVALELVAVSFTGALPLGRHCHLVAVAEAWRVAGWRCSHTIEAQLIEPI